MNNDHDRCIAIGFVERAGQVHVWGLVGLVGVREGEGSSIGVTNRDYARQISHD